MEYNFVIFAANMDLYRYTYKEAEKFENVRFYSGTDGLLTKPEKALHSIHVSRRMNAKVQLPFKNIWYAAILRRISFPRVRPVCYIWSTYFMKDIESGIVEYIKIRQPDSKHIFFFTDEKFVRQDFTYLQDKMDSLAVFDPRVAEQYHIEFIPNVYPSDKEYMLSSSVKEEKYDICFIGNDRGREKKLREIAIYCKNANLKTAFYIKKAGVATYTDEATGIHYIQQNMPYEEVIDIIKESKCVLELMVETNCTCSLRVQEAVIFNKRILTDNPCVNKMPCCEDGANVYYFEKAEEINTNFLRENKKVSYDYNEEYSLGSWLKKIEQLAKR